MNPPHYFLLILVQNAKYYSHFAKKIWHIKQAVSNILYHNDITATIKRRVITLAKFAKPVAFNEKNEKDRLMLKHVKRRNFSGYVKKLIWEDMNLKKQGITQNELPVQSDEVIKETIKKEVVVTPSSPKQLTAAERIEQLKAQTKRQQTPVSPPPLMINQQQR